MTRRVVFTQPARADLDAIFEWSETRFGAAASGRYRMLMYAAFADLAADANRAGVTQVSEGDPLRYPLRASRTRVRASDRVRSPRHVVYFRVSDAFVVVLRVLHDSMDPSLHLSADDET